MRLFNFNKMGCFNGYIGSNNHNFSKFNSFVSPNYQSPSSHSFKPQINENKKIPFIKKQPDDSFGYRQIEGSIPLNIPEKKVKIEQNLKLEDHQN